MAAPESKAIKETNRVIIIACHLTCSPRGSSLDANVSLLFIGTPVRYIGRFAPSPTGPLHFGSLVAATASYLDSRAHEGKWLLRMEDLDTARCSPAWADDILRSLEIFGFEWDGRVLFQSSRYCQQAYQCALDRLTALELTYPCACSRKKITETQPADSESEPVYPGTCRNGLAPHAEPRAWRLRVNDDVLSLTDRACGQIEQHLPTAVGDFVLKRADGPFAYQLAVVVDDAAQGVTDVVRGADLLTSTPRQIYLQRLLGLPQPRYLHVPLVLTEQGVKMSKQTGAPGLDMSNPALELWRALRFLRTKPPEELRDGSVRELWKSTISAWRDYTVQSFTASASEVIGSRVGMNSWAK